MSKLGPPEVLFAATAASGVGLLDWLRPGISRLMLEEIAANDYGEEVADHLAAIEQQLSVNPKVGFLDWCPREVLELERWNNPDAAESGSKSSGHRGHWKRLLVCTLLLQSAATIAIENSHGQQEEFFLETSASTLLQLTRSAVAVQDEGLLLALGFMLWLYQELRYPRLVPFVAFCCLLLWLESDAGCHGCAAFHEVWRWVVREELRCRQLYQPKLESGRWLVGLSFYEDRSAFRVKWFDTAMTILQKHPACPEVTDKIQTTIMSMKED